MAAGIALEVTNIEKVELAVRALNELDQKQKQLALSAAGVATATGRAGGRGHDVFAGWAKGAFGLAAALTGVHGGISLITKAIELARADYGKLIELQKDAATTQQSWGEAVGTFIANNPQLSPKEAKSWTDLAQSTGGILGAQGPQKVMQGITELRSGTPGATDEQQRDAIKRAVQQARLDPKTNVGTFASGIVRAQQATGLGAMQAHNVLGVFGERAGGDIGQLVDHIGKLSGGAAAHGTPLEKILGLFGFATAELDDKTGDKSVTNVNNLLTRIQTRQLKLNGQNVALEGATGFDKLMNLMDRIAKGEFGDKQKAIAQVSKSLGRGSAETTALLGKILEGRGRLDESVGMVTAASTGTDDMLAQQIATRNKIVPGAQHMARAKATEGRKTLAEIFDEEAGAEVAAKNLEVFRASIGSRGTLDVFGKIRGIAARMRGETGDYEKSERLRILKGKALSEMGLGPMSTMQWEGAISPEAIAATVETNRRAQAVTGGGTEADVLRQFLLEGGVQAKGGLSRLEGMALEAGGASIAQITDILRLRQEGRETGDMAEFTKALQDLVAALQEGVRQGARDGVSAGKRESTPADAGKAVD